LKRSVLAAESIVFNRASSGIYLENLLKKMGVYEQVEARTSRYSDAAAVMEHVLKGKGREIGFGRVTEILQHREKGLKLVGPRRPISGSLAPARSSPAWRKSPTSSSAKRAPG